MTDFSLDPCTVVDAEKADSSIDNIDINNKIIECLANPSKKNQAFKQLYTLLQNDRVEIHQMINFAEFYINEIEILNLKAYEFSQIKTSKKSEEFIREFFNYIKITYGVEQQKQCIYYPIFSSTTKSYIFIPIDINIENLNIHDVNNTLSKILKKYKNATKNPITIKMEEEIQRNLHSLIKLYITFITNRNNHFTKDEDHKYLKTDFFESSMQDLFICFTCLYIDNNSAAKWHLHQHIEKMLKKILMISTKIKTPNGKIFSLKTHETKELIELVEKRLDFEPGKIPRISLDNVAYRYESVSRDSFMAHLKNYFKFLDYILNNEEIYSCISSHLTQVQRNSTFLCSKKQYDDFHKNYFLAKIEWWLDRKFKQIKSKIKHAYRIFNHQK